MLKNKLEIFQLSLLVGICIFGKAVEKTITLDYGLRVFTVLYLAI